MADLQAIHCVLQLAVCFVLGIDLDVEPKD
ncbi:hypothetical protein EV131_11354 [Rhizobium laguerreae]|uniref:Uncharacterized protein n=1 Tax=Rhizobium laguerreae TaxID=1076926 RepID=A0AAX2QFZ6_9HYPH|nr:hypothetical protein EV131_11354 [Rhizobium laguerreae]